jgi:hypothetical protein
MRERENVSVETTKGEEKLAHLCVDESHRNHVRWIPITKEPERFEVADGG